MKTIIAVLMVLLTAGAASAGTVTLAGTCSQNLVNSSARYTTFTLSNLGNQTATQLLVVPNFGGGIPTNSSQSISSLDPGQNTIMAFRFASFSTPGSYASSYSVSYSQGTSTFFVVFPCVLDFGSQTTSLIRIYNISLIGSTLSMQVINLGQSAVNANITVILPQSFAISPQNANVSFAPSASKRVSFSISHPSVSGASYGVAASASYVSGNLHYASMQPYLLGFQPSSAGSGAASFLSQYLPYILIAAVVLLLLGLIIFASIRKRRMKGKGTEPKQ